jgi:hypothetical protein
MADREDGTSGPLTEAEGAALLGNLLFTTEDKASSGEKKKEDSEADSEDETEEETSESEDETEEETEEEASEESDEDSDEDSEEPEADPTYTVKVDGEEIEVPLKEALAGYSRTQDYTRKTQKLAEERKAHEAETAAVRAERKTYADQLGKLETALKEIAPEEPDWDKLRKENPDEYLLTKDAWETHRKHLAAVADARQKADEKVTADKQAEFQTYIADEQKALLGAMPEWADEAKFREGYGSLREYAMAQGFSGQDFDSITNHKVVVMLQKAMKFDAASKKIPAMKKASAPAIKPGAAKPPKQQGKKNQLSRAKERLAKSGDVRDAAEVMGALLFRE